MKKLTARAYAKINLFLEISGKREDGYHDIESVMQTVSLADTVSVSFIPGPDAGVFGVCSDSEIPFDSHNTAFQAAERFRNAVGAGGSFFVEIQKNIPSQAGLGGASTDAAAVLSLCNRLLGDPLSGDSLLRLANEIGSDVPFFLSGGTCLVGGRGEIVSPLPPFPDCHIALVRGREGMPTGEAYALSDSVKREIRPVPSVFFSAQSDLSSACAGLYNGFEKVVFPIRPQCAESKECLLSLGALSSLMSGSGTSVFGVFRTKKKAEAACAALQNECTEIRLVRPIDRPMELIR